MKKTILFIAICSLLIMSLCSGCINNQPPVAEKQFPSAYFTITAETPMYVDDAISFDAGTSSDPDGTLVEYFWDFGDQSLGTGNVITHHFSDAGQYSVKLLIVDSDQLSDNITRIIDIVSVPIIPMNFSFIHINDEDKSILYNISIEGTPSIPVRLNELVPVGYSETNDGSDPGFSGSLESSYHDVDNNDLVSNGDYINMTFSSPLSPDTLHYHSFTFALEYQTHNRQQLGKVKFYFTP